jgi:hypothetical protein
MPFSHVDAVLFLAWSFVVPSSVVYWMLLRLRRAGKRFVVRITDVWYMALTMMPSIGFFARWAEKSGPEVLWGVAALLTWQVAGMMASRIIVDLPPEDDGDFWVSGFHILGFGCVAVLLCAGLGALIAFLLP